MVVVRPARPPVVFVITAAFTGNPGAKGICAVDAGSTASIAQLITSRNLQATVRAGGYDTLADTVKGVSAGALDFTIDQSAYLQGSCCWASSTTGSTSPG